MAADIYQAREAGKSFIIDSNHPDNAIKRFKEYTRNGKTFMRNYGRTVKGGMSLIDLVIRNNERLQSRMRDISGLSLYAR